jgi:hypothetical protein
MELKQVIDNLVRIKLEIIEIARLKALSVLYHSEFIQQEKIAKDSYIFIQYAETINNFLIYNYHFKTNNNIVWSNEFIQISQHNSISIDSLNIEITNRKKSLVNLLNKFISETKNDYYINTDFIILPILDFISVEKKDITTDNYNFKIQNNFINKKVITIPIKDKWDNSFLEGESYLEHKFPSYNNESLEESVEFFWILSTKENFASELCLMSCVEYDGLPLAFYKDMIKQGWDEIRHAIMYKNISIDLINTIDFQNASKEFKNKIEVYQKTGKLIIPKEKNLVEVAYNCDLIERLVLMNIKTELPAINQKTKMLKGKLCKEYSKINRIVEFDKVDEMSHANFGLKWLKHIIPDNNERNEAIRQSDLIRGLYIFNSIASNSNLDFKQLIKSK